MNRVSYAVSEGTGEETEILKDISLSFPDRSITVITGQNGSGKSTLIKLLMGVIAPTAGRIELNGKDVTALTVTERAKAGFTLAFQQPVRFKGITVKELLDLASGQNNSLEGLCTYLSDVGLCARNYIDREADGTLSGGELKRIELATALAKGGEVFLLDEPEAGIDLWSFEELVGLFEKLRDKTVIIVSHQQKILEIADYIVRLDKNSMPVTGTRAELLGKLTAPLCKQGRGA